MILLSLQLYFGLILAVDGGFPIKMTGLILLMIVASIYSFFSPTKLTAVNAIQSNAA
jgi:hypothetical protein